MQSYYTGVATPATDRRIPSFFLYGEAPREYDEPTLHIETIEFRSARNQWRIDPHVHRSLHQLIFVTWGQGVAFDEGEKIAYRSPALVVVPAGTVHGFEFEPGTHGFVLSITADMLREMARREPGVDALFRSAATLQLDGEALRATDLEKAFGMFAHEFARSSSGHALALDGLLEVILANAIRLSTALAGSPDTVVGRHQDLVARFRELVESDFRKNKSLADYASALKVSESRLRNACLGVAEQSPMQMVNARILLEAKRELFYTSVSVSEIAYALGFDDPAYFTRFFSQRAGMSPSAFRASRRRA
jgi:AraC family transcriptional activator of pobA